LRAVRRRLVLKKKQTDRINLIKRKDIPMSKTWFITGASSGFGRELAELLLQHGGRMAATVRKPDALQALAAKYGEHLWLAIL